MNKDKVIGIYSMEELIPIVGRLTEQFTAHESSSVTYERARQLMEAVIYCIAHWDYEMENGLIASLPSAEAAYRSGLEAVIRKVKRTQEKYNQLLTFFDDYGNRNYRDTVKKALLGFFMYYDVKYAPMETIITMDYPIFGLDMNMEGIDMIAQYIDAIWKEQQYLNKFPKQYVLDELRLFHPKYENEFFNIKEIVSGITGGKRMDYRTKAINCVKDTALPVQMQWFRECNCNLDTYCQKYGETEFFFAKIIEPGHIYEMGYPKCVCPEALAGGKEVSFCECSRQGMIYVLENMMPQKHITVETIETVLSGAEKCRFKVLVSH